MSFKGKDMVYTLLISICIIISSLALVFRNPKISHSKIARGIQDAIVGITCEWKLGDKLVSTIGSGFFFRNDGYICTCSHLVWKLPSSMFPEDIKPSDGENPSTPKEIYVTVSNHLVTPCVTTVYTAEIIGIDGIGDVSVLRISINNNNMLRFAKERPSISDEVMLIGDPFGSDFQSCAKGYIRDPRWTDSTGQILLSCITTDVSTGAGSSGSPIVNKQGEVIGMHSITAIPKSAETTTSFGGGVVGDILNRIITVMYDKRNGIYNKLSAKVDNNGFFRKGLLPFLVIPNSKANQLQLLKHLKMDYESELCGYIVYLVSPEYSNKYNIQYGDLITHINDQNSICDDIWFMSLDQEIRLTVQNQHSINHIKIQLQPCLDNCKDISKHLGNQSEVGDIGS